LNDNIADVKRWPYQLFVHAFLFFAAAIAVAATISLIALSRFERAWSKVAVLMVFLLLPFVFYSVWFARETNDDEGNFWGWWMTGIVMLSPIFGGWIIGAFVGAFLSRICSTKLT
jgi:hypothetical protein